MKRRDFLHSGSAALAALGLHQTVSRAEPSRPLNILWLTCEDSSPNLGCYGDPQARTPNLDRLASQGVRFNRAFSVSGVCAPSRSCLITGVHPTTLGTLHMRCKNQPPEHIKCFPEYLRQAGYHCTNNQKQDYNFDAPPGSWDESSNKAHFRNRPNKDQPFFAVFNFTITHESKIGTLPPGLSPGERALLEGLEPHDPARITLPPYYPDTDLIRRHWAHYYDLITAMDRQAGKILAELEEDGLADNTVVFFFSDHGVGAPRGKRWLYDSGIRVPLIIRWPGRIGPGSVSERLVSFVDFAPTLLSIAGVPIPPHMQGVPFLGASEGAPRTTLFAARDRMDERYDIIRAARDERFKYIRNYEPQIPYDLPLSYPESFPIMQELRRVKAEIGLVGPQTLPFLERKPIEELYDTDKDPYELTNLAEDSAHAEVLAKLRGELDSWMIETRDLGLVPEFDLAGWLATGGKGKEVTLATPYTPLESSAGNEQVFGGTANHWIGDLNHSAPLIRYRALKSLAVLGSPAMGILKAALADPDPNVAFWAGRAFGEIKEVDAESFDALEANLNRPEPGARLGAAYALVRHGKQEPALEVSLSLMKDRNPFVRLAAIEMLDLVGPSDPKVAATLQVALGDKNDYVVRRAKRVLGIPVR
ncbi:MAG: hypothetical protein GHCLOJNM_00375 [bacterium]|nr:hypothetical protein [bacterium]